MIAELLVFSLLNTDACVAIIDIKLCHCTRVNRASMSPDLFMSAAYIYMNSFILAFGVWAIIAPDSVDAILMVSAVFSSHSHDYSHNN